MSKTIEEKLLLKLFNTIPTMKKKKKIQEKP